MDSDKAQTGNRVDAEQVRRCVSELKKSDQFNKAADLCRFLDHIVESALKDEELKGAVLAERLFQRTEDPPGRVRTMAAILRKKLKEYYANDGRGQTCRINLPRGSYIPTFDLVEPSVWDESLHPTSRGLIKPAWKIAVGFIVGLALGLVLGFIGARRASKQGPQEPIQTVLTSELQRFHVIDIDKNADMSMVRYGTVVVGRTVVKGDGQLYLLVLDSSGLKYYTQLDHEGNAPIKPCPDGTWARQVWPGTPNAGDNESFHLVVVRTNQQLLKEFPKQNMPNDSELKRLRVTRLSPIINETYIFKCGLWRPVSQGGPHQMRQVPDEGERRRIRRAHDRDQPMVNRLAPIP